MMQLRAESPERLRAQAHTRAPSTVCCNFFLRMHSKSARTMCSNWLFHFLAEKRLRYPNRFSANKSVKSYITTARFYQAGKPVHTHNRPNNCPHRQLNAHTQTHTRNTYTQKHIDHNHNDQPQPHSSPATAIANHNCSHRPQLQRPATTTPAIHNCNCQSPPQLPIAAATANYNCIQQSQLQTSIALATANHTRNC